MKAGKMRQTRNKMKNIRKKINKLVPKTLRPYLKKYGSPVTKAGRFVFRWRVFWSAVIILICLTVYYPSVGNQFIDFLSRQKPPFAKLPPGAKPDPKTTVEYKREKLTVVRTNLHNVFMIIGRDLGINDVRSRKLVSISGTMPVTATVEKEFVPDLPPPKGDWNIIKDNLVDAFKSYIDMLTVRIVSIDNKPVMIGDNGQIVPYDKTDRILQWAKYIDAAAKKYKIDPAIIAGIIEQESGGDAAAQSPAGAIGLMQLMPKTAKGLGVNPYDPAQNIDGGTRYFMYQYRNFGSLEQALAAYNAGPNNVRNGNYLYFSETQGYINKVPRLIEKYQRIFSRSGKE